MAELNVSRKNISTLLRGMQGKKFIIPEYQRPYDWDKEKCETLWLDIISFFEEMKQGDEYFLGTIVTSPSEENSKDVEIIDGQQRITSLFLLLRAFYTKLEGMRDSDNVRGLKNQIAPCIWDVDSLSELVKDKNAMHIETRVATAEDNDVLHKIILTGEKITSTERGSAGKSRYAENYNYFFDQCEEYATNETLAWMELCNAILQKCIVLPIECDKADTALTIFHTLNDRGMPLADSDIFKAQMYKNTPSNERAEFASRWKGLRERCKKANIQLDDLFRYYSHYYRARLEEKSKEIGLRRLYADNSFEKLKNPTLMDDLEGLCGFWDELNNYRSDEEYQLSFNSLKYVHCLHNYPNDFWKYLVSVYYFKHRDGFSDKNFSSFLSKVTSFFFAKFVEKPTVNAIKDDTYQAIINLYKTGSFNVEYQINEGFKGMLDRAHEGRCARALILLHTYLNPNQTSFVPENFDIEHIFPVKWQNTNYNGWTKEDAVEQLERFGNKVAIAKRLNIQAGNNYFGLKKSKYETSDIAAVKALASLPQNDWLKDDIEKRNAEFCDSIVSFFKTQLYEELAMTG